MWSEARLMLVGFGSIVAVAVLSVAPEADARRRADPSFSVTSLDPKSGENDDTVLYRFEVVNNTGKPLKDFHLRPNKKPGKQVGPKGNPMQPSGQVGDSNWSAAKDSKTFNWATAGTGIPDGGTATFTIEVSKNGSRESRGVGIGTDDGDTDPDDGKVADDDTHGIPVR